MKTSHFHPFPPLDLSTSLWVEASAGSGKTKVLTDRLLSFLIRGVSPHRILCLTFTKAAATEMEERVLKTLGAWVYAEDTVLFSQLEFLMGSLPALSDLERVRKLLKKSFDLKIQTFHSFCHDLLEQFPIEAEVPPYFSILEPDDKIDFVKNLPSLLTSLYPQNPRLKEAFEKLLPHFSFSSFKEILEEIITKRESLEPFLKSPHFQNMAFSENPQSFLEKALMDASLPMKALNLLSDLFIKESSPSSQKKAYFLKEFLSYSHSERINFYESYSAIFLTEEKTPRQNILKKSLQKDHLTLFESLMLEQRRILDIEESYKNLSSEELNYALYVLSISVLELYAQYKLSKNVLDYTDLLLKTRDLLNNPEKAPWIFYKLGTNIDHILLDEAQDTNALQWEILTLLLTNLHENIDSSLQNAKTLFVVGDEKQSIYSFQGADPFLFKEKKGFFENFILKKNESWKTHTLNLSYRSTDAILKTVDSVFKNPEALQGISASKEKLKHDVWRATHPGSVELWPLLTPPEKKNTSSLLFCEKEASPPERILAQTLAEEIHQKCTSSKVMLASKNRFLTYHDILILVRKRTRFIEELIYFLKRKGIPVNGRDRLSLKDHLGIQDLLICGKWALSPFDDLSLATLLKGPFFEFSEEALFELCQNRTETLFKTLKNYSERNPFFKESLEKLDAFYKLSRKYSPFDFFSLLLTKYHGRRLLLGRFGEEIQELLDEFLSLIYEHDHIKGFCLLECIHWMENASYEIKRDMESQLLSSLRIMTVHGSKGLEAPFVILPDTTTLPSKIHGISLCVSNNPPCFIPPKRIRSSKVEDLVRDSYKETLKEYQRLFYVALTRAQDHLLIAGFLNSTRSNLSPFSWYVLAQKALQEEGSSKFFHFLPGTPNAWSGEGFFYASSINPSLSSFVSKDSPSNIEHPLPSSLPVWTSTPASQEVVSFSGISSVSFPSKKKGLTVEEALRLLLEKLPLYPQDSWEERASSLFKGTFFSEEKTFQKILSLAFHILRNSRLSFLFGPESLGALSLTGLINGKPFSLRVDRVVITSQEIWAILYKNDQKVPSSFHDLNSGYSKHLHICRTLIKNLYPNLSLKLGILWLETGSLMEISSEVLGISIKENKA